MSDNNYIGVQDITQNSSSFSAGNKDYGEDYIRPDICTSPTSRYDNHSNQLNVLTERYRDDLEGSDFIDKVSKFEFLSHSSSPPSVKSPTRNTVRSPTVEFTRSRSSPQRQLQSPNKFENTYYRSRFSPQPLETEPAVFNSSPDTSPSRKVGLKNGPLSPQHKRLESPTGPGSVHIPSSYSAHVRPVTLPKSFINEEGKSGHQSVVHIIDTPYPQVADRDVFRYDNFIATRPADNCVNRGPLYVKSQNRSCEFATHVPSPVKSPLYVKHSNHSFDYKPTETNSSSKTPARYSQELHISPRPHCPPDYIGQNTQSQSSPIVLPGSLSGNTRAKPKLHFLNAKKVSEKGKVREDLPLHTTTHSNYIPLSRSASEGRNIRSSGGSFSRSSSEGPSLSHKEEPQELASRNTRKTKNQAFRSRSPSPKSSQNPNTVYKSPPSPAEAKDSISKKLYSPKDPKSFSGTDVPSKFAYNSKEASKPPTGEKGSGNSGSKGQKSKNSLSTSGKTTPGQENSRKFVYNSSSLDRATAKALQKTLKNLDVYDSNLLKSQPSTKSATRSRKDSFDSVNTQTSSTSDKEGFDAKSAKLVSRSPKPNDSLSSPVSDATNDEPVWLVRPEPADTKHHSLYPAYKEYLKKKESENQNKKTDSEKEAKKDSEEKEQNLASQDKSVTSTTVNSTVDNSPSITKNEVKTPDTKKEKSKFWFKLTKSGSKDSLSGKDKKSNKKSKIKKEKSVEEVVEDPEGYIDDDDYAFSSKINSPKRTKVYFSGLDNNTDIITINKTNNSEVKAEIESTPDKHNVEVIHLAAHLSDASLDSREAILNLDSSLSDSKASSESISGSKGELISQQKSTKEDNSKQQEDKTNQLDGYTGVKCFSKDTAVTNIVLPEYKKSTSVDSVTTNENSNSTENITKQEGTTTVAKTETDNNNKEEIDTVYVNCNTDKKVINTSGGVDNVEEDKSCIESYINKTPTYHDYDDVPIYDEVPPLDSPDTEGKGNDEIKKSEEKTPEENNDTEEEKLYDNFNIPDNTSGLLAAKCDTKSDNSVTKSPQKKTVTFAEDTEQVYEEVSVLRQKIAHSLNNKKNGEDVITDCENNNRNTDQNCDVENNSDTTQQPQDMNRLSDPQSPIRGAVRVLPTDTSFGVNMLRGENGKLPNGDVNADRTKVNGNGMLVPNDETMSNTDSASIDDLDMDDLTGSQQDLKELHKKMKEERKRDQEMAELEKQRMEDILKICADYEKQLEEEKLNKGVNSPASSKTASVCSTDSGPPFSIPQTNNNSVQPPFLSSNSVNNNNTTTKDSLQSPQSPTVRDRTDSNSRNSMTKIKTNGSLTKLASPIALHKDISGSRRRNSSSDDSEHDSMSESGTIKRRPHHHPLTVNTKVDDITPQAPSSPFRHSGSMSPSGTVSLGLQSPKTVATSPQHFTPRSPHTPNTNGAISKTSPYFYGNAMSGNRQQTLHASQQQQHNNHQQHNTALAELRIADSTGNYDNIDNYAGLFENLDTAATSLANDCDKLSTSSPCKNDTAHSDTDSSGDKSGSGGPHNWSSSGETSSEHSLNQTEVRTLLVSVSCI